MKVRELIERLKEFDQDLEIKIKDDFYGGYQNILGISYHEDIKIDYVTGSRFFILIR